MLEHLDSFAAIVEHRSMNKASEALSVSQPALSRKLAHLEEALGVQLFYRKGKRLELTRIGRLTYEYAVEMRKLEQRYLKMLSEFKAPNKARLTIGASLTTLQSTLPDLISFLQSHTDDLDIKAVTGKTHEIVDRVLARTVDMGVVAQLIDVQGVTSIPLFEDVLCLVVSSAHRLAKRETAAIGDLAGLPMILFSQGSWYRHMMDDLFQRNRFYPDIKMEIDSFEAIIRLASTCNYATLLPKSYLRTTLLDQNDLVLVRIPELEQAKRVTSLIYGDLEALSPSARSLIELLLQQYV